MIRAIKQLKNDNTIQLILLFVVLSYLISAMLGNSMYYTSPYFFIFLGFLMNQNLKKEEEIIKQITENSEV